MPVWLSSLLFSEPVMSDQVLVMQARGYESQGGRRTGEGGITSTTQTEEVGWVCCMEVYDKGICGWLRSLAVAVDDGLDDG